jgi:hypothetical protein
MKVEAITNAIFVSDSYQNDQNSVLSNELTTLEGGGGVMGYNHEGTLRTMHCRLCIIWYGTVSVT